jgi:hypothetical protein
MKNPLPTLWNDWSVHGGMRNSLCFYDETNEIDSKSGDCGIIAAFLTYNKNK